MDALKQDSRIGVTVLTGFLGSGKTTLLNRLVQEPEYAEAVVIVNEFGDIGVDHHLVRNVDDRIVLLEGGCICCTASGGLVDTLRDLFMLVVRRRIKPFKRVLLETTGLAGPASVMFSLRHDPFLAERYAYHGAIAMVDAQHVREQLMVQPEAAQQIALADLVVFSKADLAGQVQLASAMRDVARANPGVPMCVVRRGEPLDERLHGDFLVRERRQAAPLGRWLGAFAAPPGGPHPNVAHFSLNLSVPLTRGMFLARMSEIQAAYDRGILRIKGLVCFEAEALPWAVHGVHRQLYPLEALPQWPGDDRQSRLVFILRGLDRDAVQADVARRLQQG